MLKKIVLAGVIASITALPALADGRIDCNSLIVDGVPQTMSIITYENGDGSLSVYSSPVYEMPEGASAEIKLHQTGALVCEVTTQPQG